MNRIKVAWICHFSNQEIRSQLSISSFKKENTIKKILGKKTKTIHRDFAPWVTNLIKEFEQFEDVELHVIAPHAGLKRLTQQFELNGVFFHFFKPELPFLADSLFNTILSRKSRKYRLNRYFINRFVKNIKPDIINLIGTENPYYSIASLDVKDIPVFVSAQTVYINPARKKLSGNVDPHRWEVELEIHRKEKYYGCGGRMHRDLILNNNPNAIIFKNFFPIQKPAKVKDVTKQFDFVFFSAQVSPKKGIEDALNALAVVKKNKPDVLLNVVGSCDPNYKKILSEKIQNLGLTNNVSFNGYFPVHADMHQHIKKARFAILPIKLDVISGTVIEAMLLELPVVTYKTTGTPYLNKDGETVLLADIGDIETLAANMEKLLQSPDLAGKLKTAAMAFVEKEFDNTKTAKRLVENYRAVINHYHNKTPIPGGLLFNTEEFPVY